MNIKHLLNFSPQLLIADKVFVFNGRGFARYEVNRYNARRTKIELEFKTFYEDSKIFFVGSESNVCNDLYFVS